MIRDLPLESVAEHDDVLKVLRTHRLIRLAVVPNLRLTKKSEAPALYRLCRRAYLVGAEEDGRAQDAFESADQPPVFFPAFVHAKSLQHLTGTAKPNDRASLLDSQRCEEYGHDPVLAERHAKIGVTGDLKQKLAIAASVNELSLGETAHRQATKHERPGTETQRLIRLFPLDANEFDSLDFCLSSAGRPLGPDDSGCAERHQPRSMELCKLVNLTSLALVFPQRGSRQEVMVLE